MSDEDKLFAQNPLKAIFLMEKENNKMLKNLLEQLDDEDDNFDEDGLDE